MILDEHACDLSPEMSIEHFERTGHRDVAIQIGGADKWDILTKSLEHDKHVFRFDVLLPVVTGKNADQDILEAAVETPKKFVWPQSLHVLYLVSRQEHVVSSLRLPDCLEDA